MKKFMEEFKAFAMRGNVLDMAVGVIIATAFGKITTSLVNDIIMPAVSVVTGSDGFTNMKYVITPAQEATAEGVAAVEEVAINYGLFIQNIVDFLIIALSIFIALRVIMKFKKAEAKAEAAPPAPSNEEVLLTEIRDLLKKQSDK